MAAHYWHWRPARGRNVWCDVPCSVVDGFPSVDNAFFHRDRHPAVLLDHGGPSALVPGFLVRSNRARHHGRHHCINPAHAREVDDQADERQRRADCNDAAERVGGAHGGADCLDRRDQRERGTEVRGQTARRNEEEQQGADRGEKKRC